MFSAQQLQKFAGKKRITQETFDEAVKENIEEFEMEAEEAVASTVAEFQSQGVDLSNIITTVSGGDLSNHPLTTTVKDLQAAVDSTDHSASKKYLESLRLASVEASSISSSSPDTCRQFAAMANSLNAIVPIVSALKLGIADHTSNTQIAATCALSVLLPLSSDLRTSFLRADGIEALATSLTALLSTQTTENDSNEKKESSSDQQVQRQLIAGLLQAASASTTKDENNKCAAMEANLGSLALQILHHSSSSSPPFSTTTTASTKNGGDGSDSSNAAVVIAVCSVLSSLTTADDESLPSSRAFPNARQLAKEGAAEALVTALRIYTTSTTSIFSTNSAVTTSTTSRDVVIALCGTLRQIAANDEICQEAANSGAVPLALQLADTALEIQDTGVLRAALNVLKQLASSDGIKAEIFEAGGLETIKNSLKLAIDQIDSIDKDDKIPTYSTVAVIEQALGLLTNITLRNPEISSSAVSSGCIVYVLRAMHALLDTAPAPNSNSGSVCMDRRESSVRQGCMALRNIAARCPEERQILLAEGAESLLREIKKVFPSSCQDVGSAALRDLGLDNYNN